jgi:choline dehydrogenase-like flavoprotein
VIADGRDVDDRSTLTAQVCIVGAGAAGIPMALTLARRGVDVLLIESGGRNHDDRTNDLNKGDLVGEDMEFLGTPRPIDASRRRYLGGSTNCWFGWCRPMDVDDFGPRPWVGLGGWPFPRTEIEPWFAATARWVEIGPPAFDPPTWQGFGMAEPLVDGREVTSEVFQLSAPLRFGDRYGPDLQSQRDVRVLVNSNVVDIDTTPAADRVTGLTVATFAGNRFRVEADRYVLATGGIEVPRLLLASNRVAPQGLGNATDLVGRFFTEHPAIRCGPIAFGVPLDALDAYAGQGYEVPLATGGRGVVHARATVRLTEQGQSRHEVLNAYGMLEVIEPEELEAAGDEQVSWPQVGELLKLQGAGDTTIARIWISLEQLPQADSRLRLGRERDELGVPRVVLDWRHHPLERDTGVALIRALGAELGHTSSGRAAVRYQGVGPQELAFSVSSHHMGTTKMATDPAHGVVDPDCRVHGVSNLFVAGSAVYPTVGCSNPTFTLIALALRLADHIEANL